jgi:hypothetical protein
MLTGEQVMDDRLLAKEEARPNLSFKKQLNRGA